MPSSHRVLIVGVLGAFQAVLARWFAEWGHEARFVTDPRAAHTVLDDWLPDLLLVDHLQTPDDFEGWWSRLLSHPTLAAIPAIVTGTIGAGPIQEQAASIVRRPYTRAELESAIARVLSSAGRDPPA